MNKIKIRKFVIVSTLIVILLGTFLHFTYKLSGENKLVAFFSSTNESVWEHLKLIFFPMFLMIIIGYYYIGKETPNFLFSSTVGIIVSILFIIIFFTLILGY